MATNNGKLSKLTRYLKGPFRALFRARDVYVSGMTICAGRVGRGRVIPPSVAPRGRSHGLRDSRNSAGAPSHQDDHDDLVRAASQSRLDALSNPVSARGVRRSQSVAVGAGISRIDEDEACDFSDDATHPRSRSYAVVGKRRRVGAVGAKD